MSLRVHQAGPLADGAELELDAAAARHVQVRRLQPGDALMVFDGSSWQWPAQVVAMTRRGVRVRLGTGARGAAELPLEVTLAIGMPANERMDALVEKAAELGTAVIQPLQAARSVLRLTGERAERRRAHWQAVATAACEQCGRARVPQVLPVRALDEWIATLPPPRVPAGAPPAADTAAATPAPLRLLLSTAGATPGLPDLLDRWRAGAGAAGASGASGASGAWPASLWLLSGPEGGFEPAEQAAALAAGFQACSLGPRVLRADTAPLAALAWVAVSAG